MDIRAYNIKNLPYHFVLYYNLPVQKLETFRSIYEGTDEDNALLTYCYLDSMCGLSYKAVCWAYVSDEGDVVYHDDRKMTTGLTLREGSLECDAAVIDETDMQRFKDVADEVKENYGYMKEQTTVNDEIPFDEYRHPAYPGDILTFFFSPDNKLEKIWVREQERIGDGSVTASVLNEPYNPLMGVHEGDTVRVIPYDGEGKGKVIPVAALPWMKEKV